MRYTLWSLGRLIGHTDLDIHTISPNLRQGFIEPTEEGRPLLRDATGVMRVLADDHRRKGARNANPHVDDLDRFTAACDRREALNLELRDESGQVYPCEFMRVYDLFDMRAGIMNGVDDTGDIDEETLGSGVPNERAEVDAYAEADHESIEAMLAELQQDWDDEEMYHSAWPPPPEPDPRWDIMQYRLQVFLEGSLGLE
jgi:hypothetical protein